jgi:outer membrane biogenesis lipoprotein LolB
MKTLPNLIACLACLLLASCSTTVEKMTKNGPQGDTYLWVQNQIGGKATWQNSMGSSFAGDFEKSWADTMQTLGVAVIGWSQASVAKAKELTTRLEAGEITKRQAQEQAARIAEAELAAKAGATSEAIGAGAEITPITVTPP